MKCYLCGKRAFIRQQKNRYVCDSCFAMLFEKRVRKYCRVNEIFRPHDKIIVVGEVAKWLCDSIAKDFPLEITYSDKVLHTKKDDKIIIEWTLDDEINEYLLELFENKTITKLDKKFVKLLILMTDKETLEFARIKGLKFTARKKDSAIAKMLEKMEENNPNTRYTFFKNMKEWKRIVYTK